jgi:hypothetical protein
MNLEFTLDLQVLGQVEILIRVILAFNVFAKEQKYRAAIISLALSAITADIASGK